MNANELADYITKNVAQAVHGSATAATMLRTIPALQAEIEALKMDIHSLTYGERLTKYFNKPIAWIDKNTGKPRMEGFIKTDHDIPLYTHPVKEQLTDEKFDNIFANGKRLGVLETEDRFRKAMNLTDEEKWEVFTNLARSPDLRTDMIRFADSILLKASEK